MSTTFLLRAEKDSPRAFRSEILNLLWQNVLDSNGSPSTSTFLLRAYLTEREEAELSTPSVPAGQVEDHLQNLYVPLRRALAPERDFDDEHYQATFTCPESLPEGDVPETFLRELAQALAQRDHVQDEALYAHYRDFAHDLG
jgi:hypothetical protein